MDPKPELHVSPPYYRHYVRQQHACRKCTQVFTSAKGLQDHKFAIHSY